MVSSSEIIFLISETEQVVAFNLYSFLFDFAAIILATVVFPTPDGP